MPRQRKNLSQGYAAVFATVLIWSTPSLFQFYLNRYYDPFAQNFYRYSFACLAILPFALARFRRRGPRLGWNVLGIVSSRLCPTSSTKSRKSLAPLHGARRLRGLHSFLRHHDRAPRAHFFPGRTLDHSPVAVSARHVVGVVRRGRRLLVSTQWTASHISLGGLAIAFTASFCWALYGVLVKRPSARLGAIRSFGVISFLTSVMLLPLTWVFGKIDTPLHVNPEVNWILVGSAVLCITLAHVLYYFAIREIGVALSQTLQLLSPLGALALSAWIFQERLSPAQLWCAGVLLFGAFLATRVKPAVASGGKHLKPDVIPSEAEGLRCESFNPPQQDPQLSSAPRGMTTQRCSKTTAALLVLRLSHQLRKPAR